MKQKMAGLILAAVLASVLLSGCGSGTEQTSTESDDSYQEIELVMAVNGTDIQIDTKVAKKFAELVEEESGGRVTVAVFPNDQLAGGKSTKGIEMIAVGGADLAAYATSVMSVLDGQMSIATIPWSFDNYTEARTVIDETGGDYYAKVLEEKGITYLGSFHNGFRQISNSRHEVRTPEDVQGLKIRVPGSEVYMDFFRELKADPISMSWSEVFTAIQQGAIDGQENGVSITDSAKMYEVQDYMTLWNYTCIHRDAVSGRYPSGASHGSGADGDCASGGKQKRTGDTAQSIRKGTLDGIPGCILGPADAGHYSGRDLRRNLYAHGSGGSVRHLRTVCGNLYLQTDPVQGTVHPPAGFRIHHGDRYVYYGGGQPVCLCADPRKAGCGHQYGASAGNRRKHDDFLHHCEHYPSDRRMLPGLHVSAVYLHTAVCAGGKCPGH